MKQITHINPLDASLHTLTSREKKKIADWQSELKALPEGALYFTYARGTTYFIRQQGKKRAGISNQTDLIYQLARKKYLTLLLAEQRQTLSSVVTLPGTRKRSLADRNPYTEQISQFLTRCHHAGLDLLRITCSAKQYQWTREKYVSNPFPFEGPEYRTLSNRCVRSKSEQQIGNALERNGVPYRPEQGFRFYVAWMQDVFNMDEDGYKVYYPDFCILTASGQLIIWEHLGRVDLGNYRKRNMEKLSVYRQTGFVSDDHLILTFEKDLEDAAFLDHLIANRILPYL